MTPSYFRQPPEPEPVPLTDAGLIDAPREVARILAARNAEPDTVSLEVRIPMKAASDSDGKAEVRG